LTVPKTLNTDSRSVNCARKYLRKSMCDEINGLVPKTMQQFAIVNFHDKDPLKYFIIRHIFKIISRK